MEYGKRVAEFPHFNSRHNSARCSSLSEEDNRAEQKVLIDKKIPPKGTVLQNVCKHRIIMLIEASLFGAGSLASALPLFLGNRVCDTTQFEFGSSFSKAALVTVPVSLLCYMGSSYLRHLDEIQYVSDENSSVDALGENRNTEGEDSLGNPEILVFYQSDSVDSSYATLDSSSNRSDPPDNTKKVRPPPSDETDEAGEGDFFGEWDSTTYDRYVADTSDTSTVTSTSSSLSSDGKRKWTWEKG